MSPSLDFDKDESQSQLLGLQSHYPKATPSISNSTYKAPSIQVDRDYNPFQQERVKPSESIALTELYSQSITTAEPSKINLFEDEDFDEDLMRLPNGYWLYNRGEDTLMLDLGRMHSVVVSERRRQKKETGVGQKLLFSIEYLLNEMEKNKYRSIKKYLPQLGFEMELGDDNVLRINAVPNGLKEKQVNEFLEKLFEVLDYKTEEEFMAYYENQWTKINAKSRFDFFYKTEVEQMIKDFSDLGFPEYTSSGKKCYIALPLEDLKNKIKN